MTDKQQVLADILGVLVTGSHFRGGKVTDNGPFAL
jgi:hypothetical protein